MNKSLKNNRAPRILITSPHNLGDLIARVPQIKLLKKEYPDCEIIVCARKYVQDLASYISVIDQFVDFEALFLQEDNLVVEALKNLNVDAIIHLPSQGKHVGPPVLSYAFKAQIPLRIGNLKRSLLSLMRAKKKVRWTHNLKKERIIKGMHEFQWHLQSLKFLGIFCQLSMQEIGQLLHSSGRLPKRPSLLKEGVFNLIIHPGSQGHAKEWPQSHMLELIKQLDPSIHMIITGSQEEAMRFQKLNINQENFSFVMGKLSLKEFISLIAHADGVVANSTGPIHIASLFNTRVCGLFVDQQGMDPSVWGPVGYQAQVLVSSKACLACEKKLVDLNPGLCSCMEGIEVGQVRQVIEQWREE